jgi:hypothetical protein
VAPPAPETCGLMRVLFSILTPGFLRPFPSVVRELSARGHEVILAFHRLTWAEGSRDLVGELAALPGVRVEAEEVRPQTPEAWQELALDLRSSIDYLHFLEPRFSETYRGRSDKRAPKPVRAIGGTRAGRSRTVRRTLTGGLRVLERAVPVEPEIESYLRATAPDAVLFTPSVALRTVQPDYLRAAQALGLPTAILVTSWDNLTSKSMIDPVPDRLFVWNEIQRREAVELHGVPAERVVVTGAQCFDEWLGWLPRSRDEFCARVGLDPARPYVLWACSAPWTRQSEVDFVRRWIDALRVQPGLAEVSVLVRPHPKRPDEWREADLSELGPAAVWPRDGRLPTDAGSKADYYDSLHHAAAVVGLNTTALLEAGLLGRPVFTVLAEEFHAAQQGTLHFAYLLEVGGGLVRAAATLEEHAAQVAATVTGTAEAGGADFVREFLRPHGDVPATPIFVDEVERLAELRPAPVRTPAPLTLLRPLLKPLARRSARYAS